MKGNLRELSGKNVYRRDTIDESCILLGCTGQSALKSAWLVLSTGDTDLAFWHLPERPSVEDDPLQVLSEDGLGWKEVLEMSLDVLYESICHIVLARATWPWHCVAVLVRDSSRAQNNTEA